MKLGNEKINFDALPKAIRSYSVNMFSNFNEHNSSIRSIAAIEIFKRVMNLEILKVSIFDRQTLEFTVTPLFSDTREGVFILYEEKYLHGFNSAQNELSQIEAGSTLWIYKIFSLVFNQEKLIDQDITEYTDDNGNLLIENFYYHAEAFGRLMYYWSEIFKQPFLFESYFAEQVELPQPKSTFDVSLKQSEFLELAIALIGNGNFSGATQTQILKEFATFLNIPVPERGFDKYINDLSTRNIGSETLFLDRLKLSIINRFQK